MDDHEESSIARRRGAFGRVARRRLRLGRACRPFAPECRVVRQAAEWSEVLRPGGGAGSLRRGRSSDLRVPPTALSCRPITHRERDGFYGSVGSAWAQSLCLDRRASSSAVVDVRGRCLSLVGFVGCAVDLGHLDGVGCATTCASRTLTRARRAALRADEGMLASARRCTSSEHFVEPPRGSSFRSSGPVANPAAMRRRARRRFRARRHRQAPRPIPTPPRPCPRRRLRASLRGERRPHRSSRPELPRST